MGGIVKKTILKLKTENEPEELGVKAIDRKNIGNTIRI